MGKLLYLVPVFLLVFLFGLLAFAAGTVTVTEHKLNPVKRVIFNWVADATGDVESTWTTSAFSGRITNFITEPAIGSASPDANYDIMLKNSFGYDVLKGGGGNRSQTATQYIADTTFIPLAGDRLILSVTHAGTVGAGTAMIYIEP